MIQQGVTNIGGYAFSSFASLTDITIPDSVTSIGERAFTNCSSDLTIHCSAGSETHRYAEANGIQVK